MRSGPRSVGVEIIPVAHRERPRGPQEVSADLGAPGRWLVRDSRAFTAPVAVAVRVAASGVSRPRPRILSTELVRVASRA